MPAATEPEHKLQTVANRHRIAFLGTPAIAVPTLKALAASDLRPMAVITEPAKPVGRKHVVTPSAVASAAAELEIATYTPSNRAELLEILAMLQPDTGVVVAYGRILTQPMLEIPRHGFVNLHFSKLPRYRGATPIQAAILAGDTETGVTAMQIDAGLDTGPILAFEPEPIQSNDTAKTLGSRLADTAVGLAVDTLPKYLDGSLTPVAQPNESPTSVTRMLTKADGEIDWTQSAEQIERFIRAMNPWPMAWTEIDGVRFIIHAGHLVQNRLVIDKIQAAGKQVISGQEFVRGYPNALTFLVGTGKVAPHTTDNA